MTIKLLVIPVGLWGAPIASGFGANFKKFNLLFIKVLVIPVGLWGAPIGLGGAPIGAAGFGEGFETNFNWLFTLKWF